MININEICEKYINDENINFWNVNGIISISVTTCGVYGRTLWDKPVEFEGYSGPEITGFEILKEILQSFEPDITDEKVNNILSDISTKKKILPYLKNTEIIQMHIE